MKILFWVLGGVVAVAIGTGVYYVVSPSPSSQTQDKVTVLDCGKMDNIDFAASKIAKDCFDKAFLICQSGATVLTDHTGFEDSSAQATIVGPKDGRCELKLEFPWAAEEFPDPTARCLFDSSEPFDSEKTEIVGKCSGPIYDLVVPPEFAKQLPKSTSTNCGVSYHGEPNDDMACMQKKFSTCSPAHALLGNQIKAKFKPEFREDLLLSSMNYTILGPQDNLCRVEIRIGSAGSYELQGKSMICLFDPKTSFSAVVALGVPGKCTGDLLSFLN